jgi:serine/threonine protein kinase
MKIFKICGTPNGEGWSDLTELPLYKNDYPIYKGESLKKFLPNLDEEGLDLIERMLRCNPSERITAKEALQHVYFKDVPDAIKKMK